MITEDTILRYDAEPDYDPAVALDLRAQWWQERGAAIWATRQPHTNRTDPDRPLRIGYVSGDWTFHSAAMAFAAVVLRHSSDYLAFGYNATPHGERDESTSVFKRQMGARLVDVAGFTPAALARIIRQDKIDILVDLSGLTPHHRFETFAAQPAPIQLQGWGYVADHPWPCFQGLLADRYVAPLETRDRLSARIVDLPCVLTHFPRPGLPHTSPQPCLTKPPVFGVFQRGLKITAPACRAWSRILTAVPDATLVIASSQEEDGFRDRIIAAFDPDVRARVQFADATDNKTHLLRHLAIDLLLDTWPMTGGCSTLEALWMGVPMLTLVSDQLIQRTTGSCLHALGLDAFIAEDEAQYVSLAVAFVTEWKDDLAVVRAKLRHRFMQSPILTGYVGAVETAYRNEWRDWCAASQKAAA